MRSLTLCFASADAPSAGELATFLESNFAATVCEKEEFNSPEDNLIDVAQCALSSDYVVLLLSPDSVPGVWARAKWEPVLVDEAGKFGTEIIYVLLRTCKFPEVLRRNLFFDFSEHRLAGQRALKRWLLQQNSSFDTVIELPEGSAPASHPAPEGLDDLECGLADRPGVRHGVPRELALHFAQTHASDFEGVFWLDCANRSPAGIVGDTAHMLRLQLHGTQEHNVMALQQFCADRRLLFVFAHVAPSDRELVAFGGKASVMFAGEHSAPDQRSLTETATLFSAWRINFDACLRALGDVQAHLRNLPACSDDRWQIALSLGSAALSCLKHAGRLAEADELLTWIIDAARVRGDLSTAAHMEWEKSWILEAWGEPALTCARVISSGQPVQLSLGFAEQP